VEAQVVRRTNWGRGALRARRLNVRWAAVMVGHVHHNRNSRRMSLDLATVRRIATLARIHVEDAELGALQADLNSILGWIEQLNEVNVDGVEPLTGAAQMALKMRDDVVTDGGYPDKVLANAPERAGDFFVVPKVVE
jgi:aspartyl-tRNA(Asn)/glutamyl-tRNA(Gln) amidotransferase subunit C